MELLEEKYGNDIIDFSELRSRGVTLEFLISVHSIFVDEAGSQLRQLEAAIGNGNLDMVANQAHTIGGEAANIGGTQLYSYARGIESASRDSDNEAVAKLLPMLKLEFENIVALFDEIIT